MKAGKKTTEQLIDEVWATLDRTAKSHEEFREDLKKSEEKHDREMEKFRENLEKSREEFDCRIEKSREKYNRSWKKLEEIMEKVGLGHDEPGDFAEEYFQNSFEQGKTNFFGEHFDKLRKNLKGDESEDEYDIVLINGEYVGIVEVKFKGHVNNIPDILKQANTFRENFPKYKEHKIYLGLASMSFYKELEEKCKDEGIAIIKQVGDNVVITDEHLKAF
jgi:Skp family chaperone for outer membrane proteins